MAQWTIYGSNGVAKANVEELELHDEWMAECFVTVTVKSAEPIAFAVGDYIDYRNERYTIQYDPNVLKKASRGYYGEGFVYDNIKFVGLQDEIVRCDFNDIVLGDNNIHYTALPTFPFYCESVDDLLDRIQANLEDLYPGMWTVIGLNTVRNKERGLVLDRVSDFTDAYRQWIDPNYDPSGTQKTDPYGKQAVAESVDNITCWDALKKVHDDFELNFIIRGRVVIVGTAGVFTANTFRYGKGNGLTEIERIAESDQRIVTRLRAYGNETNLPDSYYATLNMQVFATITSLTKYGTAGASFLLDLDFDKKYFNYLSESYPGSSDRPNYIVNISANGNTVRAYVTKDYSSNKCYVYCEYTNGTDDRDEPDQQAMADFVNDLAVNDVVYFVDYVNKEAFNADHRDYASQDLPDNMAVMRLMLPGFPSMSLHEWVQAHLDDEDKEWLRQAVEEGFTFSEDNTRPYIDSPNKDLYGIRPASIFFDGNDETDDIHPTIEGMKNGSIIVDEIYAADQVTDNGKFPAGEEVKNINITLPNLGFELDKVWQESASIDMKNGMCGARSFTIAKKPYKDSNGRWVCNVQRVHDDSLNLWFPYNDFQIHGSSEVGVEHGDKYVLTGIDMPSEYIEYASVRLLQASIEALKKNHAPRNTFQPKIDSLWMQRQHDTSQEISGVVSLHDTLKAGDIFAFADADLDIDANIIIDILTIKENGNNGIPTYEVTLRDEKQVSAIQKITNKVDSVFSGNVNGSGVGGDYSAAQLISLIKQAVSEMYLSKQTDDEASGNINFARDIKVVGNAEMNTVKSSEYTGDGMLDTGYKLWFENGRAKLVIDDLVARGKFSVNELESRIWTYAGGNMVFSGAGSTIFYVEYLDANNHTLGYTEIYEPWLLNGNAMLAGTFAWCNRTQILRDLTPEERSQVVKFRCYQYSDNGTMQTRNWWHVNDLAYCSSLNHVKDKVYSDGSYSGDASNTVYHRRVAGIGSKKIPALNDGRVYDYVDLWNVYDVAGQTYIGTDGQTHTITDSVKGYLKTKQTAPYADWPAAGDVIVQRGNAIDATRQAMVTVEVEGDQLHGFKIYDTISDYSSENTQWVEIGYDQSTGKAKANVYGDFRFGCRESEEANGGSYVKYDRTTKVLDIKAKINMSSPLGDTGKTFAQTLTAIEGQIDQKAETWYQSTDPSSSWTTDAIKAEHVGDLWYCTADISGTSYGKDTTWYYKDNGAGTNPRYEWEQQNIPKSVFDTIDGKSAIFISKPSAYKERDMWVIESTIAAADLPTGCKVGDIVNATTDSTSYNKAHWVKKNCYTDDSYVQEYLDAIGGSGATPAQVATIQNNLINALHAKTLIDGGLLLTSLIGMRKLRDGGNPDVAADYTTWGGISGEYVDRTEPDPLDPTVPYAKGHGIAAWYGGDMIDYEMLTSTQQQAGWGTDTGQCRYAKSIDRFDGSGYRAGGNIKWNTDGSGSVAGGKIEWNAQGAITKIEGQQVKATTIYLGNDNITDKLNALFDMFTLEGAGTTVSPYVIKANYSLYSDGGISTLGQGVSGGGGGSEMLGDLNDVSINNPSNGQMLVYDSQTSHWLNQSVKLSDLTDVNIGSQTNGQALLWNSSTSKWVAGDMSVNKINGIVQSGSCTLGGTHTGWINIARFDLNVYGNNDAQAFDLYVRRQYNSPNSESFTCNISIGWNVGNIKVLNRMADHAIVDYIRVADSGNYRYIQLYVNPTYSTYENYTSFSIIGTTGSWVNLNEVASGTYTEVCSCVLSAESGVAYQATDNNLISHTNEFNFVPSGFSNYVHINYRTVGGQNGSIGKYIFYDGAGNALAQLDNSNGGTILTNNNIKTINGNSIFGTGDIVISGGGGGGGGNYLPLAGGTLTGLLGINTNGNTVTIGSQNNEWCHIYNSENVPFIFNKEVWTIGGLMPYDGSTYDIGSASRRWKSFYVGSINASGTSVLVGGAKFGYVCVECNSDGTAVGGYSSEINNFSGTLYLQHGSNQNLALCTGGGNVGIGTTTPVCKLHVEGSINATAGLSCLSQSSASDIRMKNVIGEDVLPTLSEVANAPAIRFTWKHAPELGNQVGSVAQYWQKVLPETVKPTPDDNLSFEYGVAALLSSITNAREIELLKKLVSKLEEDFKQLKSA